MADFVILKRTGAEEWTPTQVLLDEPAKADITELVKRGYQGPGTYSVARLDLGLLQVPQAVPDPKELDEIPDWTG